MIDHLARREHHVYEIHSTASGECVYVGMTCNLRRRLAEHARLRQWKGPAFRVTSHSVPSRMAAEQLETRLIKALQPLQNRYTTATDGLVDA